MCGSGWAPPVLEFTIPTRPKTSMVFLAKLVLVKSSEGPESKFWPSDLGEPWDSEAGRNSKGRKQAFLPIPVCIICLWGVVGGLEVAQCDALGSYSEDPK